MTDQIALLARRAADRFAELAARPTALDPTRSRISDETLTRRAAVHVAQLRLLSGTDEIVVQQGAGLHITAMSDIHGHCEMWFEDSRIELSRPGALITMGLDRAPALAEAVRTLAPFVKHGFRIPRDSDRHAPAHAAARVLIAALGDCFATMLARLGDPLVRAPADRDVARAAHAADVCKAMIDAHMPGRLHALGIHLAERRVRADILLKKGGDVAASLDLPIPERLRDMLVGHEIMTACAAVDTIHGAPSRMTQKDGFLVDFAPGLPVDYDDLEADPAARAALLREYGSDGSDLAAFLTAALA